MTINEQQAPQNLKILFAGDHYYPGGGIEDFVMIGTEQECLDKFQALCRKRYGQDWGQIVDHATMRHELDLRNLGNGKIEVKVIHAR